MYNSERIIMIVRPAIAVENLEQLVPNKCVCAEIKHIQHTF